MEEKRYLIKFNYAPSDHLIFVRILSSEDDYKKEKEMKVKAFNCFVACTARLEETRNPYLKRRMWMEAWCKVYHYHEGEDLFEILM